MAEQPNKEIPGRDMYLFVAGGSALAGLAISLPIMLMQNSRELEKPQTPSPIECTIAGMHQYSGYVCNAGDKTYRIYAGKNKLDPGDRVRFRDVGCIRPLCDPREVRRYNVVTVNGKRLPR